MNAKEYLMQVRNLDRVIGIKEREIKKLNGDMESLKSVQLGDKVKTSCTNGQQKTLDKFIDLKTDIENEVAELLDLKKQVRGEINSLNDNRYIGVLIDYYINGATLDEVAEHLNYSRPQTVRLYGNALCAFDKMILNDTN